MENFTEWLKKHNSAEDLTVLHNMLKAIDQHGAYAPKKVNGTRAWLKNEHNFVAVNLAEFEYNSKPQFVTIRTDAPKTLRNCMLKLDIPFSSVEFCICTETERGLIYHARYCGKSFEEFKKILGTKCVVYRQTLEPFDGTYHQTQYVNQRPWAFY